MKKNVIISTIFALTCAYIFAATCFHKCNTCGYNYRNSDTTCPALGSSGHYAKCKHEADQELWCNKCHASEHGLTPHIFVSAPADCHGTPPPPEGNE